MAKKKTPTKPTESKKKRITKVSMKARTPETEPPAATPAKGWTLELGQQVTKAWRGKDYTLTVVAGGYELDGEVHRTLTAAAKAVTGAKSISGPLFFGLAKRKPMVAK